MPASRGQGPFCTVFLDTSVIQYIHSPGACTICTLFQTNLPPQSSGLPLLFNSWGRFRQSVILVSSLSIQVWSFVYCGVCLWLCFKCQSVNYVSVTEVKISLANLVKVLLNVNHRTGLYTYFAGKDAILTIYHKIEDFHGYHGLQFRQTNWSRLAP